MGWNLSFKVYGDPDPHIFVYHWIQGQQACYDACGWVQVSSTYFPTQNPGEAAGRRVYIG